MKGMSLGARLAQFSEVLGGCEVTDVHKSRLDFEVALGIFFEELIKLRASGGSVYLIGNGGSAGVASHAATDFFNVAELKAITLHESSMLTCLSNDFGYENAFGLLVSRMALDSDILIAISSSGKSMNILNAVSAAKANGAKVFTLSGFSAENPLRKMGDLNLWVDSTDYGMVEIGHQFILHNISDRFGSVKN